ncbi:MAG: DMT family transporter [Thermoanaerobaculaceae bacterium]
MRERNRRKEFLAYSLICVVWGSTYLAIKVGLESFTPFWFAALRYWMAAPLAAIWARREGVRFARPFLELLPAFGVGVLFIGICNGMVFWGETLLDSSYTALLITASPLWTAIFSTLLSPLLKGEEKLRPRAFMGLGLGLVGSYLLLQPATMVPDNLRAALVVELSAVIWALGALWVRRLRGIYHPLEMTTLQMVAGAVFLTLLALVRGDAVLIAHVSFKAAAALSYLVIFGSLVAFGAYFYLLRVWSAARVATSAYINPIVAVLLGWFLLGESPSLSTLIGGAVVLSGVALALWNSGKREEEEGSVFLSGRTKFEDVDKCV